jgi:hypothetical protein
VLLALLTTHSGGAQDITVLGVARAASALYFMRTICPRYVAVNLGIATRANGDQIELGIKLFGKVEMEKAFESEVLRRRQEVEITGEQPWCRYQRDSMKATGLGFVFE